MKEIFDWERLWLNELPYQFLFEVAFRSTVMFSVVLFALRATGKRGVRQLSIFETVIIIALGSAAGDPMFYHDVGIFPALIVFITVILLYRLVTWLTGKSKWFEVLLEGKTVCLIEEGRFSVTHFKKEVLAQDEFFSELRMKGVEHLGQVRHAFLEPSGEVSVFFYSNDDIKYGLPILPKLFDRKHTTISQNGHFACSFCGHTSELQSGVHTCVVCHKNEWVEAIKTCRVT